MNLNDVLGAGPKRPVRFRVGRGPGTGNGKHAGRGMHGYYSRSGNSTKMGFEGGTMRFFRRLPRRGFNNAAFREEWATVNVGRLDAAFAAGDTVTLEAVIAKGLVQRGSERLKVLGFGELTKALTLDAALATSAEARAKVEKAGGKVLAPPPAKAAPNFKAQERAAKIAKAQEAAEAEAKKAEAKKAEAKEAKKGDGKKGDGAKAEGKRPSRAEKAEKGEGGEKPAKPKGEGGGPKAK